MKQLKIDPGNYMTDKERIVSEIREGRANGLDLRGVDLSGVDLRKADLAGADLSGADFSGADLSGARLFKVNLRGALLLKAIIRGAELTGADLTSADLGSADLSKSGIGMSQFRNAKLFGANLSDSTLSGANLEGADLRCCDMRGSRLREAVLTNADLTGAEMQGVDLSLSLVSGALFNNVDLRKARLRMIRDFKSAQWIGADIRDINFAGAYLMRRYIVDQNYLKEFRDRSRMTEFIYKIWWLTSDCGRSVSRWLFCIMLLIFFYAFLYTCVEIDYGNYETWLSPVYYSIVTITTLGYGDVLPASTAGQIIALAEVMSGYLMLGGLISIFSNKVARRAE